MIVQLPSFSTVERGAECHILVPNRGGRTDRTRPLNSIRVYRNVRSRTLSQQEKILSRVT